MFLEMFFAIIAFLTATVAFGGTDGTNFAGYKAAGGGSLTVFSGGLAAFMNKWGLPMDIGQAYGAIFLCLMALTIMYLVVRFMRVASAEALGQRLPIMRNTHVGTIVALVLTLILIWVVPFLQIWVVFGAANQLMASLALLLVTLWLMDKGKSYQWTFWPFVFMFVTTIGALFYKAYEAFFINLPKTADAAANKIANVGEYTSAQVIIGITCLILIVAAFILAWDGLKAIQRNRVKLAQARAKG